MTCKCCEFEANGLLSVAPKALGFVMASSKEQIVSKLAAAVPCPPVASSALPRCWFPWPRLPGGLTAAEGKNGSPRDTAPPSVPFNTVFIFSLLDKQYHLGRERSILRDSIMALARDPHEVS